MKAVQTNAFQSSGQATLACAMALALSIAGCSKPEKPSDGDRANEARARVATHGSAIDPVAEPGSDGGKGLTEEQRAMVVAKVGDQEITLGDVERQLASQPAFARARYRSFEKKVEFLNNLVQFELLAMEAHKRGYDTHPDVVLAMKRAMIQQFTANDLQQLVKVSEITAADIQRFYDNNRTMFLKPEQIRVSHILFETSEAAEGALAEIESAVGADKPRARIIFSDFARRLSMDRETAHLNGDLNFFSRDGYLDEERAKRIRLPAPLVTAAFALSRANEVSKVVQTDQGFHLLQLTNRRPAVNRTVEDARRQITNILLRERKDGARTAYITGLRQAAAVVIHDDVLQSLDVESIQGPQDAGHGARPTILTPPKPPAGAVPADPAQPAPPPSAAPPAATPSVAPPAPTPPAAPPAAAPTGPALQPGRYLRPSPRLHVPAGARQGGPQAPDPTTINPEGVAK